MSEHRRFDLDEALKPARAPMDASWSPRKKKIVGFSAAAFATLALAGGALWAIESRPPALPKSADEALKVMASSKFDLLDDARKRQYAAEAARLLREMSEEQRRALLAGGEHREALRAMRDELFEEMARRFARGEEMPFPGGRPGGPPQGGPPPGANQRPPGEQRPQLTQAEREQRMEEFRNRANERMDSQVSSGNAQSGGLQGEMFKRRGAGGPGGGGRGGRAGGGGGGGGGGPR